MYKGYGINLAHIMTGCFFSEPVYILILQYSILILILHSQGFISHGMQLDTFDILCPKCMLCCLNCMCLYVRGFRHGPNSSNSVTRQREVKQMYFERPSRMNPTTYSRGRGSHFHKPWPWLQHHTFSHLSKSYWETIKSASLPCPSQPWATGNTKLSLTTQSNT